MKREGRITLIARHPAKPSLDWNYARAAEDGRIAFLDSLTAMSFALGPALGEVGLDVERLIADRSGTADEFLQLLTTVPPEFTGDILLVRDDGGGYLSATGRGGDRMPYAFTRDDLRFYLEAHQLVTGRSALRLTA